MTKRKLTLATRKWKRQFNKAVQQSIAKTITEPVTNSYDSYKRMYGAADSSTGIIAKLLGLPVGTHVIHDDLLKELPGRPRREVTIRVSTTAAAASLEKRECQVIDHAEGMTAGEMDAEDY